MLMRSTAAVAVKDPLLVFMKQPIVVIHKQLTWLPAIYNKFAFFRIGRKRNKRLLYKNIYNIDTIRSRMSFKIIDNIFS